MTRIPSIDPAEATGRAKELLDATNAQLGRTPNLYRSMASSPTALDAYLAFRGALVKGSLSTAMREQVALLVAALNNCDYCVAAHTFRGGKVGLTEAQLKATRRGQAEDEKTASVLNLVSMLIERRGQANEDAFRRVKAAGWSDSEIGEIIGHVALNVFSNYFNHVAMPELDFPAVPKEGQ